MLKPTQPRTSKRAEEFAAVRYSFSAIIGHDVDGYWARCPELQGCCTQSETYEEALSNLGEAMSLHVEDRLACGEGIPEAESISLVTVELDR